MSSRKAMLLNPADRCRYESTIRTDKQYHYIQTHFNVKDEIKAMAGARWVPEEKVWRVNNNSRNNFTLKYLEGPNPYARYMAPLTVEVRKTRKDRFGKEWTLYNHQVEAIQFGLQRHWVMLAMEMGLGKSLSFFEIHELAGMPTTWYIGPKPAIASVQLDAWNWMFRGVITYMTYDELKGTLKNWNPAARPPQMVCFDEISRLKNPTSQRSQASMYLAEHIRETWGDKSYIIGMSGSPSPKDPSDWWNIMETICPGYLKEGDIYKFKRRLAIMTQMSGFTGTTYPKLVAWRDGTPGLCNVCGLPQDDFDHLGNPKPADDRWTSGPHKFVQMKNEVADIYKRLSGIVLPKFKKDCLDLPAKIYRKVRIKPSASLLRAAKIAQSCAKTAIQSMTLLRELSDGFQYKTVFEADGDVCGVCLGSCNIANSNGELETCQLCNGTGNKDRKTREIVEVPSPKLDAVTDLLEENEEYGRLVLYAGFTASIDRLCAHVKKQGWEYIRIDGRGWHGSWGFSGQPVDFLKEFQDKNSKIEKLCVIGHPGSAGMGLTLTRSSMIVYVSNTFNAEERIQSEDRCHRPGMDYNRGCTIVDLLLLPTDEHVLKNLARKRDLQNMTLGEIGLVLEEENR